MKGTDLKLTPEIAMKQLGQTVEQAIRDIRAVGLGLAEQLSAVNTTIKPIDIAHAEIAAVIDFEQPYDGQERFQPHMQLSFSGQGGGHVELHNGIRKGRYRAVILIERLGDIE